MSKKNPPAPTASAIGPCPTTIQNVGRPVTGSLPRTNAPPDHPRILNEVLHTMQFLAFCYFLLFFIIFFLLHSRCYFAYYVCIRHMFCIKTLYTYVQ